MEKTTQQNGYGIPAAIIIAGLIVAVAIFLSGGQGSAAPSADTAPKPRADNAPGGDFRPPNENDHVRGNPDAPIAVVEFSDLECPFCARLHPTLARVVEENEDVKWIYRHFPLTTIHSSALSAAVASECIARLGGNESFWSFVDAAFENQRRLHDSWYAEQASSFGIDPQAFGSCLEDKGVHSDIQEDLDEVVAAGGRGTPYTVVVTPKGRLAPFTGALSYQQVTAFIEEARNN